MGFDEEGIELLGMLDGTDEDGIEVGVAEDGHELLGSEEDGVELLGRELLGTLVG